MCAYLCSTSSAMKEYRNSKLPFGVRATSNREHRPSTAGRRRRSMSRYLTRNCPPLTAELLRAPRRKMHVEGYCCQPEHRCDFEQIESRGCGERSVSPLSQTAYNSSVGFGAAKFFSSIPLFTHKIVLLSSFASPLSLREYRKVMYLKTQSPSWLGQIDADET